MPYEGEKLIRALVGPDCSRSSDGNRQVKFVRLEIDDGERRYCENGSMMGGYGYNVILIPGDELLAELPRCPFSREGCACSGEESRVAPAWPEA